jgi:hypothetical protein
MRELRELLQQFLSPQFSLSVISLGVRLQVPRVALMG